MGMCLKFEIVTLAQETWQKATFMIEQDNC